MSGHKIIDGLKQALSGDFGEARRVRVRNPISDAHAEIDGLLVARMIIEFNREFDGVYHSEGVLSSSLCAVGPLQSMIGLAIKNGHLKVTQPQGER